MASANPCDSNAPASGAPTRASPRASVARVLETPALMAALPGSNGITGMHAPATVVSEPSLSPDAPTLLRSEASRVMLLVMLLAKTLPPSEVNVEVPAPVLVLRAVVLPGVVETLFFKNTFVLP